MKSRFFILGSLITALHLYILVHTQFIDWPEILLYPWLIKNGFHLYTELLIPYQPLMLYFVTFYYSLAGFSVFALRLLHLILTVANDLTLCFVVFNLTKSKRAALTSLILYILWQPQIEGNGLWFDYFLIIPSLLGFYFTYRALFIKQSLKNILSAGLFLGLTFLVKQTAFGLSFIYIILFLYYALLSKNSNKAKTLINIGLISILPSLIQLIFFGFLHRINEYIFWVYEFGMNLRNDSNYIIRPNITGDLPLILLYVAVVIFAFLTIGLGKIKQLLIFTLLWLLFTSLLLFPRWTLTHFQLGLTFLIVIFALSISSLINSSSKLKLYVCLIISFIFIWSLRFNLSYLRKNWELPPRFYNPDSAQIVDQIKKTKTNESYFLFGNTEYYYVYLHEVPLIKPYIQLFPWNTQITGIQEELTDQIEKNHIQYIFYSPYHPDKIFYNNTKPELMIEYLQNNYGLNQKIGDTILVYERK